MRRTGLVGRGVCVALLLAWATAVALGQGPGPAGGTPPGGTDARLEECARLRKEAEGHQKAGRLTEAVAATEKGLALEEQVYGAGDVRLLETLKALGRLHFERDDMAAAAQVARRAWDIATRGHGKGHPQEREAYWRLDYAERMVRLPLAQRQAMKEMGDRMSECDRQEKWREALSWGEKLRAAEEEVLGRQHPYYANTVDWLAGAHEGLKEWAQAVELRRQALAVSKTSLGQNYSRTQYRHGRLIDALGGLADKAETEEDFARAAETRREVVQLQEGRYGKDDWRVVDARLNLASVGVLEKLTARQREELARARQDNRQAVQLYSKGQYQQALPLVQRALEVRKAILGEKHSDYATTLHNLATVYSALGDNAQALKIHLQVRALRQEILSEKHPDYATTLSNLALVYRDLGDNAQALKLYLQVRELRKEILGEKHPDYATTLHNLATVYSALGDNTQALKLHLQVRDLRKELGQEKHPDYATTLDFLAAVYHQLGDNKQALQIFLLVRDLRKEIQGEKHPDYAHTLNNLATVYYDCEEYAAAALLFREALAIRQQVLGSTHADTLRSLTDLTNSLVRLADQAERHEDFRGAAKARAEVAALQEARYGKDDWRAGDARRDLAHVSILEKLTTQQRQQLAQASWDNSQGDLVSRAGLYQLALPRLLQALEVRKTILGEKHPDYAQTRNNLAVVYRALGDNKQALQILLQVRDLRKEILGEKHPAYASTLHDLALVSSTGEEHAAAAPLFREALAIRQQALGSTHADTLTSLTELVNSLVSLAEQAEEQENFRGAAKARAEVVALVEGRYGKDDWRAMHARLDLAHVGVLERLTARQRQQLAQASRDNRQAIQMCGEGQYQQALPLFQRALEVRRAILGEKHPDYVTTLHNLATVYSALGDNRQALQLLLQVRDLRKEILGGKHPDYAHTVHNLAAVHSASEDHATAVPLFREALTLRQQVLGSSHADTLTSLTELVNSLVRLAEQAEEQEDFRGAAKARAEVVALQERRYDEDDWRVADARLDLAYVGVLEKLTARQRQQLAQASRDNRQAVQMCGEGQYQQALPLVLRALEVRRAILGEKHPDYASTLHNLATVYSALGINRQALQLLLQVRDLRKEMGQENHPLYATTLNNLAGVYHDLGDNKRALQVHLQVRDLRKEILGEKHPDYAATLNNLAAVYHDLGDSKRALQLHLQVRDLRQELGQEKHPDYATTLNNLAEVYGDLGDIKQALKIHLQVRDLRKEILGEKHPAYATTLHNLASVYAALGDNKLAIQLTLQVRDLQKVILQEKHPNYATTLGRLANVYRALGDAKQALKIHLQVRELRKGTLGEKHPDYATTLNDLANDYCALGENAQALQLYLQVRDLQKEILGEKHPNYATTLNNLAGVYNNLGDHKQALQLHLQVRELRKEILGEKHPNYATTLNNLAGVYNNLGDHKQALQLHLQVRELRKEILGEKHPDYATTLNNLAGVYHHLGDNMQALQLLLQVRNLEKEILGEKHPHYATTLNNLAEVYSALGDNKQALQLLLQVRDLRKEMGQEKHPDYATTLNNLAGVYHHLGDNKQALQLLLQVRDLLKEILGEKHPDYARTLNNLAMVYRNLKDHSRAAALSRQASELIRNTLENSAAALAERQQLGHIQSLHGYLDNYLVASADTKLPEAEVYAPVLAWRGAVTARQRLIRAARDVAADPDTARLFPQLEDASRQLAALYGRAPDKPADANVPARIEDLLTRRERLEVDLAGRTAAFRQMRAGRSLTPSRLQELLPAGVALIDFVESGSAEQTRSNNTVLTAFVVRREEIRRVQLGKAKPIAEAVRAFRGTLRRGRPVTGEDDPAVTLRRLVWEPLEEALKGAQVVLLSPDGPLNDLPFAALPGKDPGKYLLEEVALAVVPVPQMLPELLQPRGSGRAAQPPSLLVLGDIDYDAAPGASAVPATAAEAAAPAWQRRRAEREGQRQHWERRDGMRLEALGIADTFRKAVPQGRLTELKQRQATEAAMRQLAPKHEYLHFATHGFFAPREVPRATVRDAGRGLIGTGLEQVVGFHPGLLSGLVLAGANKPGEEGDDGVLTALEVSELDLSKVELAVLSACETGLGEVAGGEGVVGLQRAFQVAGARTTVTSLWKVEDMATQALMTRFYENYWKRGKGALEALREAQLWMLREGPRRSLLEPGEKQAKDSPPYYWAAFILSGDWR